MTGTSSAHLAPQPAVVCLIAASIHLALLSAAVRVAAALSCILVGSSLITLIMTPGCVDMSKRHNALRILIQLPEEFLREYFVCVLKKTHIMWCYVIDNLKWIGAFPLKLYISAAIALNQLHTNSTWWFQGKFWSTNMPKCFTTMVANATLDKNKDCNCKSEEINICSTRCACEDSENICFFLAWLTKIEFSSNQSTIVLMPFWKWFHSFSSPRS